MKKVLIGLLCFLGVSNCLSQNVQLGCPAHIQCDARNDISSCTVPAPHNIYFVINRKESTFLVNQASYALNAVYNYVDIQMSPATGKMTCEYRNGVGGISYVRLISRNTAEPIIAPVGQSGFIKMNSGLTREEMFVNCTHQNLTMCQMRLTN